ncbi:unnamed protein product [Rhizophagus irregularis]|nr:unnamed protein product [Rhizophagus irregularis]
MVDFFSDFLIFFSYELDFRKDAGFLELDKTGHSKRDTNFLDLGEMTIWIDMNASFAMYYSFAALILRH